MNNRAALWQEGTATVGRRTPHFLWSFVPLLPVWLVAMIIVLVFAGTLVLLAAFLLFLARRARRKIGIPSGEIFYQDLVGQPFQAKVLRSPRWGISGKPDCLIRTPDGIVPVELKKSKRPLARGGVYPNHMIQNLTYCALIEDQMQTPVPWTGDLCGSTGAPC